MADIVVDFEFSYEFTVIGFVSAYKPFQMAWHLGKQIEADFTFQPTAEIDFKSKEPIKIRWFLAETHTTRFELICNLVELYPKTFLVPEFSFCDYLLKIQSDFLHEDQENYLSRIKEIDLVVWAQKIELASLKRADYLIFN